MRKLLLLLTVASAALLTACDNDNSVNPQPLGKAKISGTVFAEYDYTNNTTDQTWDKVANTKLVIEIYDDYTGTTRYTETITDANGNYTLELEIGNHELYVSVAPIDYKATVKYVDGTEEETFYGNNFDGGYAVVTKGGEYVRDIYQDI